MKPSQLTSYQKDITHNLWRVLSGLPRNPSLLDTVLLEEAIKYLARDEFEAANHALAFAVARRLVDRQDIGVEVDSRGLTITTDANTEICVKFTPTESADSSE